MTLFMGLDLGQAQDYTALSIVEVHPTKKEYRASDYDPIRAIEGLPLSFDVRHTQRYTLGTSYPSIVEDVVGKIKQLEGTVLAIDHTGVGRPVFDLFERAGLQPIGITITGGDAVYTEGRQWKVPKRDVVGVLQVAIQGERLKIAKELEYATTLTNELLNFRVKINLKTAHDSYEAWREGVHDDLVLSLVLALFTATRFYTLKEQAAILSTAQEKLDNEFEGIMRSMAL
jgi:hypothetical protein